jgi:hypothetical protein
VILPYSSSRFEIKLLLFVINHRKGRNIWWKWDIILCRSDIDIRWHQIQASVFFTFCPVKAKKPERGSIYVPKTAGLPSDKSSIQMKMNVGTWWNETDRRKPQYSEIEFFPVLLCQNSLLQKWVSGIFPGGKGGRCIGLTTLPPSCADWLEIWERKPPGTHRSCPGL